MIPSEIQAEILTRFFSEKQSARQIARDLGLNRRSILKVVRRRSIREERVVTVRKSILDPFKDEIRIMLTRDARCPAPAILNRLRELGYPGGISILTEYLRKVRSRPVRRREAFLRLEFAPGEAAQVDWGEFGDVFGDGVKIHCFGIVLCYSRYLYVEFTRSEKFEDFIRCHERAFRFFGGVPKQCWYDNLTSAVTERAGSLIRFNARFLAYMGHHGIRPHACNVARGNEKGRVEGLVKYIRKNFWAGRSFANFADLTTQAIDWQNQIANQREHRATRRIVRLMFQNEEHKVLMRINPNAYDTDETLTRVVPPDFHVIYETNRYSVPWTLIGMAVTLKVSNEQISVYYHEKIVTGHPRSYQKAQVFTKENHRQGVLAHKPGAARIDWQFSAVKNIGPKMADYVNLLRSGHRSLKSELSKILALSTVYGDRLVHEACWDLLERGVIGVEALELTLKRLHHPQTTALQPEPLEFSNQNLNRNVPVVDLRHYDALLFEREIGSASHSSEDKYESRPDRHHSPAHRTETPAHEPGSPAGPRIDERDRKEDFNEIPGPVDCNRKIRT